MGSASRSSSPSRAVDGNTQRCEWSGIFDATAKHTRSSPARTATRPSNRYVANSARLASAAPLSLHSPPSSVGLSSSTRRQRISLQKTFFFRSSCQLCLTDRESDGETCPGVSHRGEAVRNSRSNKPSIGSLQPQGSSPLSDDMIALRCTLPTRTRTRHAGPIAGLCAFRCTGIFLCCPSLSGIVVGRGPELRSNRWVERFSIPGGGRIIAMAQNACGMRPSNLVWWCMADSGVFKIKYLTRYLRYVAVIFRPFARLLYQVQTTSICRKSSHSSHTRV